MGTNDAWGGSNANVETFTKNLQTIIDTAKAHGVTPIIARMIATNPEIAKWQVHQDYLDAIDKLPCNVQWGIGIYPAYALTDGAERPNVGGGNDDSAVLVPEFSFDLDTAPMLFIHGDADGWAAMNSVKTWEKMRAMGIQSELHTLALRPHCFQLEAVPGTGSYTFLERIGETG